MKIPFADLMLRWRVAAAIVFLNILLVVVGHVKPASAVVFEISEEPEGIRWTVLEGGKVGPRASDINEATPALFYPEMRVSRTGDVNTIYAGYPLEAPDVTAAFRWLRRNDLDLSNSHALAQSNFSSPALSDWGTGHRCPDGSTQPAKQMISYGAGGKYYYLDGLNHPACWAEGATALFEGTFADLTIIPGVESTTSVVGASPPIVYTFRTRGTASLTIIHETDRDDGSDFDFLATLAGPVAPQTFTLDDALPDDGDGHSDTKVLSDLMAGTYEITETLPPLWDRSVECTGGSDPGEVVDGTLMVDIAPREDVVCRFTNTLKTCPDLPLVDCRQPLRRAGSVLKIVKKNTRPQVLTWSWGKGEATDLAELGDPLARTSYAACLWETSGEEFTELLGARADGGLQTCGRRLDRPCWGTTASGFGYLDRATQIAGLRKIKLTPGAADKAKVRVSFEAPLPAPTLPLSQDTQVVFQLISSTGLCWEASYEAPALRNDSEVFKDRNE